MDIAWLTTRPEVAGEPEACSLCAGCYYLRARVAVGVSWAQRGDRLYRLEVESSGPVRFGWRLLRLEVLIAHGSMQPPRLGGLREALGAARHLCEQSIRLDTTLGAGGSPMGPRLVTDKDVQRVRYGRKSAERFAALRAAHALAAPPQGGPEQAGERLRWARCRKGWALAALAVRAGISTSSAQRMEMHESGRQLPLALWLMVATALEVDQAWLLLGRGSHEPAPAAAEPRYERAQAHA